MAIYCASCKPGYKPTFLAPNLQKVISICTEIENCDLEKDQKYFNFCSQCKTGYVFEFLENKDYEINIQKCIPHSG